MTKEEIKTTIQQLQKDLINNQQVYKLNDGKVDLEVSYKTNGEILQAIQYFAYLPPEEINQ